MQDIKRDIANRVFILYFSILVVSLFILGRIAFFQTSGGEELRQKARDLILEKVEIKSLRGNILTEDARLLATTIPIYDVHMDFKAPGLKPDVFKKNADSLAYCLANYFKDKTKNQYKELLTKNYKKGNRFLMIQKGIYHKDLEVIKKFPLYRLGSNKGGLIVTEYDRRVKPYGMLASRLIGKISEHGNSIGLEIAYDEYLRGKPGRRLMQRLAGGIIKPASDVYEVHPEPGADIVTSLNIDWQDVAMQELKKVMIECLADHGCMVVMEVATGDIKVMINLKRLNDGSYVESLNYAIMESVEPGSTFKLMSIMAALEDGLIQISDSVQTGNGVWVINANRKLSDVHGGHGKISIKRAFEISSNIGVARTIFEHYKRNPERFLKTLSRFRLGEPLGIEIPTEPPPAIYTNKGQFNALSIINKSIGYEVKLTPLQILAFYNAVANNGVLVKPRFVKEVRQKGQTIKKFPVHVLDSSIAKKSVIDDAQKLMEGVVENGTASNLRNTPYKIAGKTGTAWVFQEGKGYIVDGVRKYRASFIGYFPADKPKYSAIVMITDPQGPLYYGGSLAAPVFKAVSDRIFATSFNLHEALNGKVKAISDTNYPKVKAGQAIFTATVLNTLNITNGFSSFGHQIINTYFDKFRFKAKVNDLTRAKNLPDLKGYAPRDAVYLLETFGAKSFVEGRGAVIDQDPPPGTPLNRVKTVKIKLG